jgi:hypothetical protein
MCVQVLLLLFQPLPSIPRSCVCGRLLSAPTPFGVGSSPSRACRVCWGDCFLSYRTKPPPRESMGESSIRAAVLRAHMRASQELRRFLEEDEEQGPVAGSAPLPMTSAICPTCGKVTSEPKCVCGTPMEEALNLWRAAAASAEGAPIESMATDAASAERAPIEPMATAIHADAIAARDEREDLFSYFQEAIARLQGRHHQPESTGQHGATNHWTAGRVATLVEHLPAPSVSAIEGECSVCLCALQSHGEADERASLAELPCHHMFHRRCLGAWWGASAHCGNSGFAPTCALCKSDACGRPVRGDVEEAACDDDIHIDGG